MIAKIAIHVCPVDGCPALGSKPMQCPTHDKTLVREVYTRVIETRTTRETRVDEVVKNITDPKFRRTLEDMGKRFGL
jgi:hypothetical protein